ncbi:hypothetical protein [Lapidilactobacillus wuchangensis]|uniref:hypothetical protein n=1 Tax=Lapidilactobacillus wuchangensis TaxID=2486001 RepID=UPI0013DE4F89|nr:hypothetical protein [Lapidilactobacillus wuchangensis]
MEGVVVSRQIILSDLSLSIRLVLMTIWFLIGINRCRPRSTTSKPVMQSDSILFQHLHQNFNNFNSSESLLIQIEFSRPND